MGCKSQKRKEKLCFSLRPKLYGGGFLSQSGLTRSTYTIKRAKLVFQLVLPKKTCRKLAAPSRRRKAAIRGEVCSEQFVKNICMRVTFLNKIVCDVCYACTETMLRSCVASGHVDCIACRVRTCWVRRCQISTCRVRTFRFKTCRMFGGSGHVECLAF